MKTHALFSPHTTSAINIVSLVQHHTPSFSVTPMVSDISIFFTQVASCEGKHSHHSMAFLMQSFIDSSSRNVEANGMTQRCLNLIWCLSTQTSIFVFLDDGSFKTHVFIWREGISHVFWRSGKEREVGFYNQIKSDRQNV